MLEGAQWQTIRHDLHVVQSVRPDLVTVQLGTNDLSFRPLCLMGFYREDFVRLVHDSYGVPFVCVCHTIRRRLAVSFNKNVKILARYLRVDLEPILYAICWGHEVFVRHVIISWPRMAFI